MLFILILGFAFLAGAIFLFFCAIALAAQSLLACAIVIWTFAIIWWIASKDWGVSRWYHKGAPAQRARPQTKNIPEQFIPHHKHVPPTSSLDDPGTHGYFDPWGIA